jgi:hypothetical protein
MARCVGPTGKVYGQVDEEAEKLRARMTMPVMNDVTVLVRQSDDPVPSDLHDLDLITFYFAYHDTSYMGIDRAKMDKAMFAALKRFLVIADHSARPEDGATVARLIIGSPSKCCVQRLRQRGLSSWPKRSSFGIPRTLAPALYFAIQLRWTSSC